MAYNEIVSDSGQGLACFAQMAERGEAVYRTGVNASLGVWAWSDAKRMPHVGATMRTGLVMGVNTYDRSFSHWDGETSAEHTIEFTYNPGGKSLSDPDSATVETTPSKEGPNPERNLGE
jgi:hypothetical protein